MQYDPNRRAEGQDWGDFGWDEWTERTREFYRAEGWKGPGLELYSRAVALVECKARDDGVMKEAIEDEIVDGCSRRFAVESMAASLLDQMEAMLKGEGNTRENGKPKRARAAGQFRSIERDVRELSRTIRDREFESFDDLNEFLDNTFNSDDGPRESRQQSRADTAQDLIYDAWESESQWERIQMAQEALEIDPDCADAYVLLAREGSRSSEEYAALMRKGVEAAERALGKENMDELEGHFWGFVETRPYMRARLGLAQGLEWMGKTDEAIAHYRDLLRLNPVDNQGARYLLATCLMRTGGMDELEELVSEYEEDCSAEWHYNRALLAYHREGDSINSRRELKHALKANKYVPAYLLGKKKIADELPEYVRVGGAEEAAGYSSAALAGWRQIHGALAWLRNVAGRKKKALRRQSTA